MSAGVTASIAETLQQFNLTESEYRKICLHLGRDPNFNELAMFSVLWSEHCCYKNSRHLLKLLPSQGARVLHGPGENAGVIDIGDGIQVAFKIESHNHPTAVEPFQGAATGVGGILRDIFTMNARPVACLNALRFGPIHGDGADAARNRYLLSGAVRGIAHYGNCVGVPTVSGDVFFDAGYRGNPLVNAMAVGVIHNNQVMSSRAVGMGNPVLYAGSATGRDGMGGAAFASRELDEKSHEDCPAVQVGDPFAEKLLIEACLEAFATGCVVAAQDMGAAGLTSSSCEMAAKGQVGMTLDLDKVPAREPDMRPWEYLLSESQERMLLVLARGKEQPVLDIFSKWRIPAVIIGEVTEGPQLRFLHRGQVIADLPAPLLTDLAPSYDRGRNPAEPESARIRRLNDPRRAFPDIQMADVPHWLTTLLDTPNIARPSGIFSQYDRHVRNDTLLSSENLSAGVIRLRWEDGEFSGKALAVTVDCNPRYVALEPYQGAMAAVAEAVRNVTCTGARPLAVSDNLNFGNPEKPDIYYQLFYAVQGIKDACEAFEIPVVSGNVSLYNEHGGQAIHPTPTIGMIGLIDDDRRVMSPALRESGLKLAIVGRFKPCLGGSEYQAIRAGQLEGSPPDVDLNREVAAMQAVLAMIHAGKVCAVQDVSTGGLLVTLLEMTFLKAVGVSLTLESLQAACRTPDPRLDELLFGETAGAYIVAYRPEDESDLKALCPDILDWIPFGQTESRFTLQPDLQQPPLDLAPLRERWSTRLAVV